jgi:hypothetical protein
MIIQLDSATAKNAAEARSSLQALARSWGHEISQAPPAAATPAAGTGHGDDAKTIDPVSLTALILSIPSAALAVSDLADRIRKRQRARELIDHAEHLAAQQVTIYLISAGHTTELRALTPDQVLDLADEDPAS